MNSFNQIKVSVALLFVMASSSLYAHNVYPEDVQALINRADSCMNSMAAPKTESAFDRQDAINKDIAYYCTGLDQQIVDAKEKHHHSPKTILKISEYDDLFYTVHWLQVNGLI